MVSSWSRASLARWWNHRARAWWLRIQPDQCSAWPGGDGRAVAAMSRRTSGTVSAIMPGSAGGGWPGCTGMGAWVLVRSLRCAAVTAQTARAAMTRMVCRRIAW